MNHTHTNGRPAAFWTSEQAARQSRDEGHIKAFLTGWTSDRGHYIEWMSVEGVWCPDPWYQEHGPDPYTGANDSLPDHH